MLRTAPLKDSLPWKHAQHWMGRPKKIYARLLANQGRELIRAGEQLFPHKKPFHNKSPCPSCTSHCSASSRLLHLLPRRKRESASPHSVTGQVVTHPCRAAPASTPPLSVNRRSERMQIVKGEQLHPSGLTGNDPSTPLCSVC